MRGAGSPVCKLPAGQRHFLHVDDLSSEEFREVMDLAKKKVDNLARTLYKCKWLSAAEVEWASDLVLRGVF